MVLERISSLERVRHSALGKNPNCPWGSSESDVESRARSPCKAPDIALRGAPPAALVRT